MRGETEKWEKLIELYNKSTGKTEKRNEILQGGVQGGDRDTSTTDKLDILLPIRI